MNLLQIMLRSAMSLHRDHQDGICSSKDIPAMGHSCMKHLIFPRHLEPWTYLRRLCIVILGLFLFATGVVCMYRVGMGLGPWDVLHQGISRHTLFTFGQANIVVSALIILLGFFLRIRPGVGTLLNMFLIGVFVDLQLRSNWLSNLNGSNLEVRLLVDACGVLIMGLGTALYISPRLGAGPRDGLMLRLNILTKVRLAAVRAAIEFSALLLGFFMGGTVGTGTLLFAFGIGPSVEISFWMIKKLQAYLEQELAAPHRQDEHVSDVLSVKGTCGEGEETAK